MYRQEYIYACRSHLGTAPPQEGHHPCRGETAVSDRLHHFGVLLSELVLGQTISLTSDPVDDLANPVCTYNYTDILSAVRNYSIAKDAIDFCFSQRSDSQWVLDNQHYAKDRLDQFIKRVFEPMLDYYQVVHKRFQGDPGRNHKLFLEYVGQFQDDTYENFDETTTHT